MTTSRMMLATALFGLLALPALAQPTIGAHQVRATHHRIVRHAPVHHVAATPEGKAPGTVAASPRAAVTSAPLAGRSDSVTAPVGMPGAVVAAPRVATTPATTPALPGAARTN
ncbi:MAG: hypothetical protein ACRYHQ_33685 [Janthinobacterium lividum]